MPKITEAPFMDLRERARKADVLYEKLREQLEKEHLKEIIAIEPDSGDYFIGKDRREAEKKARAKHPDKLFFRRRIGPRTYAHVVNRQQCEDVVTPRASSD